VKAAEHKRQNTPRLGVLLAAMRVPPSRTGSGPTSAASQATAVSSKQPPHLLKARIGISLKE